MLLEELQGAFPLLLMLGSESTYVNQYDKVTWEHCVACHQAGLQGASAIGKPISNHALGNAA